MAKHQPSSEGGAPEWMVSYADMITIMMAFFVVLYASTSASGDRDKGGKAGEEVQGGREPVMKEGALGKEKPGSQSKQSGQSVTGGPSLADMAPDPLSAVFDSLHYRFGPAWTVRNCWTGGPPELKQKGNGGSNARTGNGGTTRSWSQQNVVVVTTARPNEQIIAGGRIVFPDDSASLDEGQQNVLLKLIGEIGGKMQRIEIRGHTSRKPLPENAPFRDRWDLAYARARAVEQYLFSQGIDPRRVRLAVAADTEPLDTPGVSQEMSARVDIRLLNEWVKIPGAP